MGVQALQLPNSLPTSWWPLAAALAALVLLVWLLSLFESAPRYGLKSPLTKAEARFFAVLLEVVPELHVFPQVGFSAFLEVPRNVKNHMRYFAKISQKRCDFLLCDKELRPLLIVELDDWSHTDLQKDADRDALPASAGLPTLRVRWSKKSSAAELREAIFSSLRRG